MDDTQVSAGDVLISLVKLLEPAAGKDGTADTKFWGGFTEAFTILQDADFTFACASEMATFTGIFDLLVLRTGPTI